MGQLIVSSTLSEKKKKQCVCEYFGGFGEREELDVPVFFSASQLLFFFFPLSQPMSSVPQFRIASLCVFCTHTHTL